jgi:hypothetical protein
LLEDFKPDLDSDTIILRLGYPAGAKASPKIVRMVSAQIAAARKLMNPRAACVRRDITGITAGAVSFEGGVSFKSAVLAKALSQSRSAFAFATTIGKALEDKVAAMMKGDSSPEGLILDTIGSEVAELLAEAVSAYALSTVKKEDMCITQRFSPGYCDWDVAEQTKLFKLIGPEAAGITLNASCQMIPRKSVSGVIGIGTSAEIGSIASPCKSCERKKACDSMRSQVAWSPTDRG